MQKRKYAEKSTKAFKQTVEGRRNKNNREKNAGQLGGWIKALKLPKYREKNENNRERAASAAIPLVLSEMHLSRNGKSH